LLIAPHTALELVRRLEARAWVRIVRESTDQRRRLLALTSTSEALLEQLSEFMCGS
jgi:DNA-binding MarR family transcriptional regulator